MSSSYAASLRSVQAFDFSRGASVSRSEQLRNGAARIQVLQQRHGFCRGNFGALLPGGSFQAGSIGQQQFVCPQLEKLQRRKQPGRRRQPVRHKAVAKEGASSPPYNVVITGSSKGIGLALAKQFLAAGDRVCLCARDTSQLEAQCKEFEKEYPGQTLAWATDVTKAAEVADLANFAKQAMGHVDVWINNAGTNAYTYKPLVENSDEDIEQIVATNTLGVMLCCRQAIKLMQKQGSRGHIFNMDGAGADGNPTPRFAAYGATKRGLAQFTKSLQAELKLLEISNVTVHNLSPGMVTTDLLMAGADRQQARFFINALAEPPDVVADFLVPRIRATVANADGKSKYIRFLTSPKAYSQILARLLFKSRKDRYVKESDS
ncbi:Chlorophyll b reductase [Klebsormidium nitens]|uniref:Chlorophyll b reductase n=1 Tax=Klebsormidium nitens TaxID=105231 RepID=A0A1Y1I9X9_KLENI|nr:Chlorophyll b reductase [Klebsormidium nitens]|eukprot:GAQ87774.1 Chlorophyll b reductase [Klebsormidium nitens]